jgi:beta-mannanase
MVFFGFFLILVAGASVADSSESQVDRDMVLDANDISFLQAGVDFQQASDTIKAQAEHDGGHCDIGTDHYSGAQHSAHTWNGAQSGPLTKQLADDASAGILLRVLREYGTSGTQGGWIFGHQHTNVQGQWRQSIGKAWKEVKAKDMVNGYPNNSDVQHTKNKYPGVVAYNMGNMIEYGTDYLPHIKASADMGSVLILHYEAPNPVTCNHAKSKDKTTVEGASVALLALPPANGGNAQVNDYWLRQLDAIAEVALAAKDSKGILQPLIFRLLHEDTGFWFWWGIGNGVNPGGATTQEYKDLYVYSRYYLTKVKNVKNLLFAYSPAKPSEFTDDSGTLEYRNRYPGNNNVDVICFDRYGHWNKDDSNNKISPTSYSEYMDGLINDCHEIIEFAEEKGKVAAICETGPYKGLQMVPDDVPNWWKTVFMAALENDPGSPNKGLKCREKIAWMQTWTNQKKDEWWVPIPADQFNSADLDATEAEMKKQNENQYEGFKRMANDPTVKFAGIRKGQW